MLGLYVNFNSPFGKHFIGTSESVDGICSLLNDVIPFNAQLHPINPIEIETTLRVADQYYKKLDDGVWFVVQETTHKYRTIRRVPVDG